jgi:hypothetical protein
MAETNTMFRVLITQYKRDDKGDVTTEIASRKFNGVERQLVGGVVQDDLGEKMGYVYDQSKYDKDFKRKPEHLAFNWYPQ